MATTSQNTADSQFMDKYNYILGLFAETDKKFKETDEKFKETDKKIDKLLKSMEQFHNFTTNISQTVESLFYRALLKELEENEAITINGFTFYKVFKNATIGAKKAQKEVDIILADFNRKVMAVIEVKTKLHPNDVEQLENIKKFVKKDRVYRDYNVIWGFAAANIPDDMRDEILQKGYFLIEFNTESNTKRLILPKQMKVFNAKKDSSFFRNLLSLFSF